MDLILFLGTKIFGFQAFKWIFIITSIIIVFIYLVNAIFGRPYAFRTSFGVFAVNYTLSFVIFLVLGFPIVPILYTYLGIKILNFIILNIILHFAYGLELVLEWWLKLIFIFVLLLEIIGIVLFYIFIL